MNRKKNNIFHSRTGAYWLMLLPALVWMIMINIVPMFGIVMAFQDYNPGLGIFRSEFIGLENFEYMFQMKDVSQIFTNTVVIAVGKLLLNVFVPVVFALLLNEIKNAAFKKSVQTIVYLRILSPGLSWVEYFWMCLGYTDRSTLSFPLLVWSGWRSSGLLRSSGSSRSERMCGRNLASMPWFIWRR